MKINAARRNFLANLRADFAYQLKQGKGLKSMTYKEIGYILGVGESRARQICCRGKRRAN